MVSTKSTSHADAATRICPGPGMGSCTSRRSRTSGPPKRATSMARMSSHRVAEIGWRHVSGCETRVVGVDVERDDAPGMDPDDLGRQMALWVVGADSGLRQAANLKEVDALHGLFRHLIGDEGHVRICLHVAIFRTAAHVEPGDVDSAERLVVR